MKRRDDEILLTGEIATIGTGMDSYCRGECRQPDCVWYGEWWPRTSWGTDAAQAELSFHLRAHLPASHPRRGA